MVIGLIPFKCIKILVAEEQGDQSHKRMVIFRILFKIKKYPP